LNPFKEESGDSLHCLTSISKGIPIDSSKVFIVNSLMELSMDLIVKRWDPIIELTRERNGTFDRGTYRVITLELVREKVDRKLR
jgi:hypothetical protein